MVALHLSATYNQINVDVLADESVNPTGALTVEFRPTGAPSWRRSLPPWRGYASLSDVVYGIPIVGLSPGTAYEVRALIDGLVAQAGTITTRAEPLDLSQLRPTHFLHPGGSDEADGTSWARAWRTLERAVLAANDASADLLIAAAAGPYRRVSTPLHGNGRQIALAGYGALVYDRATTPAASQDPLSLGPGGWAPEGSGIWSRDVGVQNVSCVAFGPTREAEPTRLCAWNPTAFSSPEQFSQIVTTNYTQPDGHWQAVGTTRLYVRLPGGVDPNAFYLWLGVGEAYGPDGDQGLVLAGPDLRVAGFRFNALPNAIRVAEGGDRALIERCVTSSCTWAILANGLNQANPIEDVTVQDCALRDSRLWSDDGSRQIAWHAIKSSIVLADGSAYGSKPAGRNETHGAFARRHVRRLTVRRNLFDGTFNGLGSSISGSDRDQGLGFQVTDNAFTRIPDNPIEHEGSVRNWGVGRNRYADCNTVYSTDFSWGPVVYFREEAARIGNHGVTDNGHPTAPQNTAGAIFKWGPAATPATAPAGIYVVHCTLITTSGQTKVWNDAVSGTANQRFYSRNNLLGGPAETWDNRSLPTAVLDEQGSVIASKAVQNGALLHDNVRYDSTSVTGPKSIEAWRAASGTGALTNQDNAGHDHTFLNAGANNGWAFLVSLVRDAEGGDYRPPTGGGLIRPPVDNISDLSPVPLAGALEGG